MKLQYAFFAFLAAVVLSLSSGANAATVGGFTFDDTGESLTGFTTVYEDDGVGVMWQDGTVESSLAGWVPGDGGIEIAVSGFVNGDQTMNISPTAFTMWTQSYNDVPGFVQQNLIVGTFSGNILTITDGLLFPYFSGGVLAWDNTVSDGVTVNGYDGNDDPATYLLDGVFGDRSYTLTLNPVSAVPIPAAVWLFGSGLIGMLSIARPRKRT